MKKIASFEIDHDKLVSGMYTSRIDEDVITYDLRVIIPNIPPYLENDEIHTVEHLFSTYVRNSESGDKIIYFGPMGCRTGFYFLTRNLPHKDAIELVKGAFDFTADFKGEVPGAKKIECGNYLDHNLEKANEIGEKMRDILRGWKEEDLQYP